MINSFYNDYSKKCIAKELWGTIKIVDQAEEASSKEFFFPNYMEFKMIDEKLVSGQDLIFN